MVEMEKDEDSSGISSLYQIQWNYLFFSSYFLSIAVIHVFHAFLIEKTSTFARYFFASYTLVQSVLETSILILVSAIFRQFLPRFFYRLCVGLIFILFLSHVIDFPLVRLMDMSFWFALHFISQESYQNFMELLYASNVSLFVWGAAGLGGLGVILGGVWIFCATEKWTDRHPMPVSYPTLIIIICTATLFLINWERSMRESLSITQVQLYQKVLPWKTTLTPSREEYFQLEYPLKLPEEEPDSLHSLDSRAFSLSRKPDIYLFIIESLREDYIVEKFTPNLHAFKQNNIHFDLALSNANGTQLSWFSIFFSKFPFYFGKINAENWKRGSIPLRMLRKLGYKIHALSSARLSYYEMDHLIFGEAKYLADSFFIPDEEEFAEPYQKDQAVMEKLIGEVKNPQNPSGRVFLIFLDATHLDYSWPREDFSLFHPFEEKINYFKAALGNTGVEGIKNRYCNSLYFVDSLIGKFLGELEESSGGKEAVIILTSDHGEEFNEHGHLFHASELTHQQTHIPLYYRFGQNSRIAARKDSCAMTSHMDIFPSIFHYIIGEDVFGEILQGQSIFRVDRWPYVISGRFNASRAPYEFFIHNGAQKMIARFNATDIFQAKSLEIVSTKNLNEEYLPYDVPSLKESFGEAIDRLFGP